VPARPWLANYEPGVPREISVPDETLDPSRLGGTLSRTGRDRLPRRPNALPRARRRGRPVRPGAARARTPAGRPGQSPPAEQPGVRDRLLRHAARRRGRSADEPALRPTGARDPPATDCAALLGLPRPPRAARAFGSDCGRWPPAGRRPDVDRDPRLAPGSDPLALPAGGTPGRPLAPGPPLSSDAGPGPRPARDPRRPDRLAGGAERSGRPPADRRHDRHPQGSHAHAPEPRRQRLADGGLVPGRPTGDGVGAVRCPLLPHLRPDGGDELRDPHWRDTGPPPAVRSDGGTQVHQSDQAPDVPGRADDVRDPGADATISAPSTPASAALPRSRSRSSVASRRSPADG
jgi:hypothetical protein